MSTIQSCEHSTVLITGASGFIGRHLLQRLNEDAVYRVHLALRTSSDTVFNNNEKRFLIDDISGMTDWTEALTDCDVVIHMAARVHVMQEYASSPLNEFRRVNVEGTLNLAKQAASLGIKRFIFISSIKVNGEETESGHAYNSDDLPGPKDPYGISKYEAEQGLLSLSKETGMQVVIIRPPLVYGPSVKGNFKYMLSWLAKGYPLPLKSIDNKRSFVSVYNLIDLIVLCIQHPQAANQVFMVSDDDDLSISELLIKMAKVMNKPTRLVVYPPLWMIKGIAKVIGKEDFVRRLCGSLQVDITKTCDMLGWSPAVSTEEALRRTVDEYISVK